MAKATAKKFKTADQYTKQPGLPHNKQHSKNYCPDVPAPKQEDPSKR